MAENKIKAMVKGKIVENLTPIGFEMAKKYFGAVKVEDLQLTKPIELTKPLLIPRVKIEKPEELTKPAWDEKLKDVKTVEMTVTEVPAELAEKVAVKASGDPLAPKVATKKVVTRKKK